VPALGFASLEALREHIGECHRCPLGETRTRVVFGVGDPHARVVFIGEGPGKNEDLKGEPFVGVAGQLLNELLAHAGLERSEVYIANVVKCRPPGNRDPEPIEIETCTPFLREQIRIIKPDVLVTLGNFATKFVLKTDTGITRLHGKVQQAGRFAVLPIFHPAAAIYDRTKRDALFADFERLRELLAAAAPAGSDAPERGAAPTAAPAGGGPAAGRVLASASQRATGALGEALAPLLAAGDVLVLSGDLGAGKTQLTKGIARALGVAEPVTSPTFNLLLAHEGRLGLNHFDLYRLDSAEQLEDLDYWGTLESDGVSVVEWGDRFADAMPADGLVVRITITGDESRELALEPLGERGRELAAAWIAAVPDAAPDAAPGTASGAAPDAAPGAAPEAAP
jgi:DNA polymerase